MLNGVKRRGGGMVETHTCLWFDGAAEEAARTYVALVPGSALGAVLRPAPGAPVVLVRFSLAGTPYAALNGGPSQKHGHAASIVVAAEDQAAADAIWDAHLAQGSIPVACGWLTDRWGLSWQVFPRGVLDLLFGGTPAANARAFAAMQAQVRIDTAAIAAAAAGA
jgi:predicted 3-demethylubiquinone-9 3-methyltransferase (glyoxalase superfamily)